VMRARARSADRRRLERASTRTQGEQPDLTCGNIKRKPRRRPLNVGLM